MPTLKEQLEQLEKEDKDYEEWILGDYDNPENGCPNCGRSRICICKNGKHRCEKCNWVIEDNNYCKYDT